MCGVNKKGKLIFRGEKGESLFIEPFTDFHKLAEWNVEVPELFKKMESTGDDRSFAIVSALVIEHHIDRFLQIWIPGYNKLSERFTFSLKIDLLDALKLIPHHILRCTECIRKVRNDFAHHLDLDSFKRINQGNRDRLRTLYEELYGHSTSQGKSIRELFNKVAFVGISGIRAYEPNIIILQEVIQSDEFLEKLRRNSETKFDKEVEEIVREEPKEIESRGNLRVERFRNGVTKISTVTCEEAEKDTDKERGGDK